MPSCGCLLLYEAGRGDRAGSVVVPLNMRPGPVRRRRRRL